MGTAVIVPKEQTQRTPFLCIYKYLHTLSLKKKDFVKQWEKSIQKRNAYCHYGTTVHVEDCQSRNVSEPPHYIFIALGSASVHLVSFAQHKNQAL